MPARKSRLLTAVPTFRLMTYPTVAGVVRADREQIFRGRPALRPTLNAHQERVYELFKKFRSLGGSSFKPYARSTEDPAARTSAPIAIRRRP